MNLDIESIKVFTEQGMSWLMSVVPTFVLAIVTLVVGLWLIGRLVARLKKLMLKSHTDPTLTTFGCNLISMGLKLMLGITVISMLGVATTSFIAILGAAGLAIGLALQGNLANFAGGALILILKPFKLGDYIVSQGVEGVVMDINVFCTALDTLDNQRIYVPNGALSSNVLKNLSTNKNRRVDVEIVLGSDVSVSKAKEMFLEVMTADPLVLSDEQPFVSVEKFSELGVHYTVRAWAKNESYWDAFFSLHEGVKKVLEKNGLKPAIPTRKLENTSSIKL